MPRPGDPPAARGSAPPPAEGGALAGVVPVWSGADLDVHVVSDGLYWNDGGAMFGVVPRVLWQRHVTPDHRHRVPLALNCLLVRDRGTVVLVDTGYGAKLSAKEHDIFGLDARRPGLAAALAALGVAPEDVDVVVNTHLHGDHCGGNTLVRDGRAVPAFPKARYIVQRREYADALFPNLRTRATYVADNIVPVEEAGQLEIVDADVAISDRVRGWVTRGHTQSHQCVVVEPRGAPPIVFLGDLAPRTIHLERPAWVPAVDVLPLESLVSKVSVARWAVARGAVCVFQHDDEVPVGRVEADGRRFRVLAAPLPARAEAG